MLKVTSTNYNNKKWLERSCGLSFAFELLTGRWKMNVVWKINEGIDRYSQLKLSIPGISEKVLYERLLELEEDAIIKRITSGEKDETVRYYLTDLGEQLIPILLELWDWGDIAKSGNLSESQA